MKSKKILLVVIVIVCLCLSWLLFVKGLFSNSGAYEENIEKAEASISEGLYEQAVEFYKQAFEYRQTADIYYKIKEAYELLYKEEHTSYVRNLFIDDMAEAAEVYPKDAVFWEAQVNLYLDAMEYSQAFSTLKQAINYGASSENIDKAYNSLLYKYELQYKLYYGFKTALNGYITINDGNQWTVIDEIGNSVRSNYKFIGLINDGGKGLYIGDIDTRLIDGDEITRARFSTSVDEAGIYNDKVDLLPVEINGIWRYMKSDGSFVGGKYTVAGSFYDKSAVAYTGKKWVLLNENGEETELKNIEDIKLDLYGCHYQNGIIIAKEAGKYHLYDGNFNKIGDFAAEDIDICIDGKTIAFQNGGKWGFVDISGNVIIEPKFAGAKSFANGYAAVCDAAGKWGFLNSKYELCIDYEFLDAFYFNSNETCLVSAEEGTIQILEFVFD